jgi:hypothetical protein
MKKSLLALAFALGLLGAPLLGGGLSVVYTDIANVFTANQRINAGLGINVAPGATGTLSLSDGVFERSRATKLGEWAAVTYSSGNFTASSGTWTVDSGDQAAFSYTLVGKTMVVSLALNTTSVSSTPTTLQVTIPGGFLSAADARVIAVTQDNGGTQGEGIMRVTNGGSLILFYKDVPGNAWSAATNSTSVSGTLTFPVQ